VPSYVITDEVQLKELVGVLIDEGAFVFDVETMGTDAETGADIRLDPRRNEVVWLSFATRGLAFTVPVAHPHGQQIGTTLEPRVGSDGKTRNFKVPAWSPAPPQIGRAAAFGILEPLFYAEGVEKGGHNVKFDLESTQKYYDDEVMPGPFFDTQVAAHTLNENHHTYRLGDVVKREYGFTYDKKLGERIERYGFREAAQYSFLDSKWTWLLRQRYSPLIGKQKLDGLWALEMDVLEVLLFMETEGALLDVDAAEKLYAELGRERERLRGTLYRIAGHEVNLNSAPQMQKLLFDKKKDGGFGLKVMQRTKGGAPSTAKAALEAHAGHPFVGTYQELQEVDKVWGTYLKAYLGGETERQVNGKKTIEVKPSILVEGKLHANFKQHGTVTGRFSCSEPNLQNIPRPSSELGKQVRGLFIAPPDHKLIVADYAQIEYVVMGHFSRDPMLVKAFTTGIDLHQYVAAMVFGKSIDDVSKSERGTAKNTNFAVAYGAGDEKVAAMSGISLAEAVGFRKAHKKMMPKLYRWTEGVVQDCRRAKPPHVKTLLGRRRRLPTIHSQTWSLRSEAERQAVNSVVQGSAADIIKVAMVRLHRLCDEEMRLSLSVHDELVLVVPDNRVEDGQAAIREAMLGPGIASMLNLPMNIDLKVVDRWADAK